MTTIDEIRKVVLPVLRSRGVRRAGLFGSLTRGELTDSSDIDILVEVDRSLSLLDFVGIKQELEDALQRRVDLIEYDSIRPALRNRILSDEVRII